MNPITFSLFVILLSVGQLNAELRRDDKVSKIAIKKLIKTSAKLL